MVQHNKICSKIITNHKALTLEEDKAKIWESFNLFLKISLAMLLQDKDKDKSEKIKHKKKI